MRNGTPPIPKLGKMCSNLLSAQRPDMVRTLLLMAAELKDDRDMC